MDFNMTSKMKEELMKMAGLTDISEFNKLLSEVAPLAAEEVSKTSKVKAPEFNVHLVKILSLLEYYGMDKFDSISKDNIRQQIIYVYEIVMEEFPDMGELFSESNNKNFANCDRKKCEKFKEAGNSAYVKKNLEDALNNYRKAINCAPINDKGKGDELSKALANRSAVYFEMNKYYETLNDIEAAFHFGYPMDSAHKLFERRAKVFLKLNHIDEAKAELIKAKQNLENQNKSIDKINKLFEQIPSNVTNKNKIELNFDPFFQSCEKYLDTFNLETPHHSFPALNSKVSMKYDKEFGRYMVANNDIEPGEVILMEEPVISYLDPSMRKSNCYHCFGGLPLGDQGLPSPYQPSRVKFCSIGCLRSADIYHKFESKMDIVDMYHVDDGEDVSMETSERSYTIALTYRAILQKGLQYFLDHKNNLFENYDVKFGYNVHNDFKYDNTNNYYRCLFNLMCHSDKWSDNDRLLMVIRTVFLLRFLQFYDYFMNEEESTNESKINDPFASKLSDKELYISELLLHFQSGIKYNHHAVYKVNDEINKLNFLSDIGCAVYPTLLFFNHSCVPNTLRINYKNQVIMFAKRDIRKGEEISDCYGIHHLSMDKSTRLNTLKKGYEFDCLCPACDLNYPQLNQLLGESVKTTSSSQGVNTYMTKVKKYFDNGEFNMAFKTSVECLRKLEGFENPNPYIERTSSFMIKCLWKFVTNI